MRQGLKRIAALCRKRTKAVCKERPTEAPLQTPVLLFSAQGTMSGKPAAAQINF